MSVVNSGKPNKYCLYPIGDEEVWALYKQSVATFWTAEEIDLENDRKDFETLRPPEQDFIKLVLAFFASSDAIVNENLHTNFKLEIDGLETKFFYAYQEFIECIHQETYSELINSILTDEKEKHKLFNALENFDSIKAKADWAFKYMNKDIDLATRLFAFTFVEGLQFQSSFAAIFYFKKRNKMGGLCKSNEFISRDEGLHAAFSALQFRRHNKDTFVDQAKAERIVTEVVNIEKQFMKDALNVAIIGMNAAQMEEYIEFVADYFLNMLGFDKMYHTKNPFDFMQLISLQGKTNMFEARISEYAKAGVMNSKEEREFSLDVDF